MTRPKDHRTGCASLLRPAALLLAAALLPSAAGAATNGPLKRSSSKPTGFVDRDGNAVWLTGMVVCCKEPDAKEDGWPWISLAMVDKIANSGANWAHIRLGPFTRWGEGNDDFSPYPFVEEEERYELDLWNQDYWTNLRTLLAHARMRGVYVEVDLIDGWLLKQTNESMRTPWRLNANRNGDDSGRCELMSAAPQRFSYQERFLQKVAAEIGEFDNVIFQVGNETSGCLNPVTTPAWEGGVIDLVAAELARLGHEPHIFSTSSERDEIEALPQVNYVNEHFNFGAIDQLAGKPTGVNEYNNNSFDADRYTKEVWSAFTKGTFFHYSRGQNTDAQVDATLARLAIFRDVIEDTNFGLFDATPLGPNHVGRPTKEYVAFLDVGGSMVINLGPSVHTFAYAWINPRNGNTAASGTFTASGNRTFDAPSPNMWVLHVTRANCTAPVEAPVTLEPSGSITDTTPTFTWTAVPDADVYTLFARKVLGGQQVLHVYNIAGTSFTPSAPLPTDGAIEWKVKGEACQPPQGGPYSFPYEVFEINVASPHLSIGDASVVEGNAGTANLTFTVSLTPHASVPVSVDVATVGGTATPAPGAGADYQPLAQRITIPAGVTSWPVSVTVLGDTVDEPNETVLVGLSNPAGAPIDDGQGVGTIVDDDPTSLSITGASLLEGDMGTVNAVFTVALSLSSPVQVRVGYRTVDGSAVAPGDYGAISGELVFDPGQVSKTVTVPVVGDEMGEADETFLVELFNPVNAVLPVPPHAIGTIQNDESAWKNVGTGDFNGDGKTDILWRHDNSGQLVVWFMDGTTRTGGTFTTPPSLSDLAWRVRGTGDFNGDGKVDILWRHEGSGQLSVWFMDGTVLIGGTLTTPEGVADLAWKVRSTGDFNGDGKVDILWRHEGSGQMVVWEMNGTSLLQGTFTSPPTAGDINWVATATGDFDRDGKLDILFRHRTSGEVVVWFMEGTVLQSGTFTTPSSVPDLAWKLVATGDFNGDGKVDIVWRHNAAGQNVAWLMNGAVLLPGGGVFLESLY